MLWVDGTEFRDEIRRGTEALKESAEAWKERTKAIDRMAATIEKYFAEGNPTPTGRHSANALGPSRKQAESRGP